MYFPHVIEWAAMNRPSFAADAESDFYVLRGGEPDTFSLPTRLALGPWNKLRCLTSYTTIVQTSAQPARSDLLIRDTPQSLHTSLPVSYVGGRVTYGILTNQNNYKTMTNKFNTDINTMWAADRSQRVRGRTPLDVDSPVKIRMLALRAVGNKFNQSLSILPEVETTFDAPRNTRQGTTARDMQVLNGTLSCHSVTTQYDTAVFTAVYEDLGVGPTTSPLPIS